MKTKSIIYQSFVPNAEIKPIISQDNNPSFKYTGYKPRYKWSDDDEATETTETTSTPEATSTSDQITFQDPSSIDWSKVTGYENQPIITQSSSTSATTSATRQRGKHIFKDPSIQVGEMQGLLDAFADAGISLRITSGTRPGARTAQGKLSNHALGRALDITPVAGQTQKDFEDLAEAIRNAPDLVAYMKEHGYGIYDETTPEALARTKGTGAHWHLGPDDNAIKGLETILKGHKGLKIPILFAKDGIKTQRYGTRKEQKRIDQVTEMILHELNKKNRNISTVTGLRYEEPLQPLTQEIMSFVPGVGDAIEASSIIGNLLNNNWKQALISAGLLALPGNASKISKTLGFQFNKIPINEYVIINTSKGPAAINLTKLDIDKNIKNTKSSLAKRYDSGGADRTNLPNLSKEIQTAEPLTGELEGLLVNRNPKQPSFNFPKQNNIPSFIFLSDIKTTLPEVGNNSLNKILTQNQRRQLLDHEIQHKIDLDYRPDFYNSKLDLINGTEYQKRATEIGARVGQLKDAAGITDGSKIFTEQELKDLFDNYLKNPENIDNGISTLRKNVKDWTKFTKWVNDNVPLLSKSFKSPLYINSQEDESEN